MATRDFKAVEEVPVPAKLKATPATLEHVGDKLEEVCGLVYCIKRIAHSYDNQTDYDRPYCALAIEVIAEKAGYLADRLLDELGETQIVGDYDDWISFEPVVEGGAS